MRVPRVHVDQLPAAGAELALGESAARHVRSVLRLKAGAPLVVFDGRGTACEAELLHATRAGVRVKVGRALEAAVEAPLEVVLALGVSRGERMDLAVQKAVELGTTGIVPLLTERAVVRLDEDRARRRHAHWQAIAVAACEQCGRNRLPTLHAPVALADYCAQPDDASLRLLLAPEATVALRDSVARIGRTVALAAGPESGFTAAEEANLAGAGFIPVRLGARVLRTETAALAALAALNALAGDF